MFNRWLICVFRCLSEAINRALINVQGLFILGLPEAFTDLIIHAGTLIVTTGRYAKPLSCGLFSPLFEFLAHMGPFLKPGLVISDSPLESLPNPINCADIAGSPW